MSPSVGFSIISVPIYHVQVLCPCFQAIHLLWSQFLCFLTGPLEDKARWSLKSSLTEILGIPPWHCLWFIARPWARTCFLSLFPQSDKGNYTSCFLSLWDSWRLEAPRPKCEFWPHHYVCLSWPWASHFPSLSPGFLQLSCLLCRARRGWDEMGK